jgi:hypothetical protein
VHGSYGGFEYAAWEARREMLEEARKWRLAKLARRSRPGFRERVGRLLAGLRGSFLPRTEAQEEIPVGGAPSSIHLERGDGGEAGAVVEEYLGGGGRVVRRTDLLTGASTDSFLVDGRVRR